MENSVQGVHEWKGHTNSAVAWTVHRGDASTVLSGLAENQFNCVITSPPYYWQRDYKVDGQIGLEATIEQYVCSVVSVMREVKRVLRKDGVLFLNLGDTYYSAKGQPKGDDRKNGARRFGLRAVDASGLGVPRKTAIGIPWRVALRMIDDGWTLRSPIIWRREGALPEATSHDRPWRTYETVFLFSKSPKYYFDRSGLQGSEDVWTISDRRKSTNGVHSAAFPEQLVERCISVGCPPNSKVLDPFAGSGTVLRVATQMGHEAVGIDLSERYCAYMTEEMAKL